MISELALGLGLHACQEIVSETELVRNVSLIGHPLLVLLGYCLLSRTACVEYVQLPFHISVMEKHTSILGYEPPVRTQEPSTQHKTVISSTFLLVGSVD